MDLRTKLQDIVNTFIEGIVGAVLGQVQELPSVERRQAPQERVRQGRVSFDGERYVLRVEDGRTYRATRERDLKRRARLNNIVIQPSA